MKLVDLPAVRALSVREELELVDELWEDVGQGLDRLEVTAAEKSILDERWAHFLGDSSSALTLEQFKQTVEKLRT
jgi:putative addiction module component (TIGR02574 family)